MPFNQAEFRKTVANLSRLVAQVEQRTGVSHPVNAQASILSPTRSIRKLILMPIRYSELPVSEWSQMALGQLG